MSEDGFDWYGHWITMPFLSECTRFEVDPVEYYGEAYIRWRDRHEQATSQDR